MQQHPEIVQRDDGAWTLGWHDEAPGPFETREHAQAVAKRITVAKMPASVFAAKPERRG